MDQGEIASCLAAASQQMWSHYTGNTQAELLLAMTTSLTNTQLSVDKENGGMDRIDLEESDRVAIGRGKCETVYVDTSLKMEDGILEDWEIVEVEETNCVGDEVVAESVGMSTEPEYVAVVAECLDGELKHGAEVCTTAPPLASSVDQETLTGRVCSNELSQLGDNSIYDSTDDIVGASSQTDSIVGVCYDREGGTDAAMASSSERIKVETTDCHELSSEPSVVSAREDREKYSDLLRESNHVDIVDASLRDINQELHSENPNHNVLSDINQNQSQGFQSSNVDIDTETLDTTEDLNLKADIIKNGHSIDDDEDGRSIEEEAESEGGEIEDVSKGLCLCDTGIDLLLSDGGGDECPGLQNGSPTSVSSSSAKTERCKPAMIDTATSTDTCPDNSTSPAPDHPHISHTHSQTTLSVGDLVTRSKEKEELEMMKVELHVARDSLNQEKSQRMVAEELVKIIQSDLSAASSRNTSEVMTRVQLENELTDVKVS